MDKNDDTPMNKKITPSEHRRRTPEEGTKRSRSDDTLGHGTIEFPDNRTRFSKSSRYQSVAFSLGENDNYNDALKLLMDSPKESKPPRR